MKRSEAKVRAALKRRGLILAKCRRRDPQARDFGLYRIVDFNGRVVAGGHPYDYSLTLDEVVDELSRL
jgi:hypothetical protein